MNILLVYPQMPDTFYAMKHFLYATGKKSAYPPLGLLTIASLLPPDWCKKLVDLNTTSLTKKDLVWANFVFISAMNVQEDSVRQIVSQCRQAGVRTVAGGSLFTNEHERFPDIDHFILNEAELTLPLFVEDVKGGTLHQLYQSSEFADLTQSPLPDYTLVKAGDYLYSILQYSRGCPYQCDFCDVTALLGRRIRTKDPDQIIQELDSINQNSDTRLVLFADDNLIGNKKKLKEELLPAIIEWRKKNRPSFLFATQLSIDLADDSRLISLLIDAGFRQIFIGIETPDEGSLSGSGKKQNLKRNQLDDIRKLQKAGFFIAGGFIVGFDQDTPAIFQRQADFIQESGIPLPIVNILKAPPCTELYQRMKQQGRLSEQFAFAEGDTNIIPLMGEETLRVGFMNLITGIYEPAKSYERLITFFNIYRPPKSRIKVPVQYGLRDVSMAARILYVVGIQYHHRKYFWKLIRWALRNNRHYLDVAILYGIMIYQMHQTFLHIKQHSQK